MARRSALTPAATALFLMAAAGGAQAAAGDSDLIARGKYLTTAGDCIACHTIPGGKPFSGNRAMETPFGTIYTPNITPDKATGIGNWTDDQFYRAVHEGIGHNGEYLYPVFPFPWFTKVTRDDVMAIKAYLFSVEPVEQKRQKLEFKFPFNIRTALLGWRTAFFKAATFKPDPNKSDEVNRGAYLVEGLGHCGECHNQHNVLGASDWSGKLKGGEIQGWYAPNITASGTQGVGAWTEEQLVTFLKSGSAPGQGVVLGPMHETIQDSLQYLTDADLKAMAVYLKSFSAKESYKQTDANQAQVASGGADAYLSNCASCHRPDGKGIEGVVPSLVNNGAVRAKGPQDVIRVVLGGLPALNNYAPMPAAGAIVSDQEIADIVNYVRTAWGNGAPANAEPGMVEKLRATSMTLMSSTTASGCVPPAGDTPIAKIDKAAVQAELKGVKLQDMLQHIVVLLPKVQGSAPDPKDDDGIINAMMDAYCPVALADESVPPAGRTALIGSFGTLVYSQIHHYENGLAAVVQTKQ